MKRRTLLRGMFAAAVAMVGTVAFAQPVLAPVTTDPPRDPVSPARMEVIHIPSGGEIINGIVYVAAGKGPHPTLVLFHGLPGNERNLDLAQAVRRDGWTVVVTSYRGAWGNGGVFRFGNNLEDAKATLAFVRNPANATRLGIDASRIVVAGHSMGGWVAAHTLATDPAILGSVIISMGDFGRIGRLARTDRATVVRNMNNNRESLAGVTGDSMADELAAHADQWSLVGIAPRLTDRPFLVLYSEDFVKDDSVALIAAIDKLPKHRMRSAYTATDHSWSDARIALETQVIDWLRDSFPR